MSYFNEPLLKQDLNTLAFDHGIETTKAADNDTKEFIYKENSNFQIANLLSIEKSSLIEALAQFPATALWLINKYTETDAITEQEEDLSTATESALSSSLQDIKKQFHDLSINTSIHSANKADKESLSLTLQLFPFSFHDLTELINIFAYSYKYREIYCQDSENKNGIFLKRLETSNHHNTISANQWLASLTSYDEQFLFLSSSDMHKHYTHAVFCEHNWLKLRQKLATANTRLVLFIANQYKGSFLDFDDLVQEGQTGLLKAIDRYDYRLGFQFSTYAGYWIRQAISRALSRCERVVRIPCGRIGIINKVFRTKEQLIARTGKEPTTKELAEHTALSKNEIHAVLSMSQIALSFEGSSEDGEISFAPIDFIEQQTFTPAFIEIAKTDLDNIIDKALKILNPREARVICCHFGIEVDKEMTLQEIGLELDLTRERVRQIQVIALNKIKHNFGEQLMNFL
jgi:RNA polymerase sigma factor (sigma-70 family)